MGRNGKDKRDMFYRKAKEVMREEDEPDSGVHANSVRSVFGQKLLLISHDVLLLVCLNAFACLHERPYSNSTLALTGDTAAAYLVRCVNTFAILQSSAIGAVGSSPERQAPVTNTTMFCTSAVCSASDLGSER